MSIKTPFAIALFTLGLTKTKYTDLLGYVLELWQRFASPKTLDSMLDFFDVLVFCPCASLETRSQLLFALSELLWGFSRRIDEAQWRIFRSIVKDLKLEESLADLFGEAVTSIEQNLADESKIFQKLTGKSVLIYTLTESAALRVKTILEAACQPITVVISDDRGGNDRLSQ
ncbi:hypothetical protein NDI43_25135 [Microcoleus vaginatus GB2-A3]|uniref:hypothetical protein n=1 Tax=Microcoleus vaginatus TaxID=119532 RepID=UPI0032A568E8